MDILINKSIYSTDEDVVIYSTSTAPWAISGHTPESSEITQSKATLHFDGGGVCNISKGVDTKSILIVDDDTVSEPYDGRESIINSPSKDMIHPTDACGVAVNSAGDYREFNAVISTVYDNMDFLLDYSNSVGGFPWSYENRYGYLDDSNGWAPYPDGTTTPWGYDEVNGYMATSNDHNVAFIHKPTSGLNSLNIQDLSGTASATDIIYKYGYLGYNVGDVKAIHATNDNIVILDSTKNSLGVDINILLVYVRGDLEYTLTTYWGDNYGLAESLEGAIDMAIYDGDIYVLTETSVKVFNVIGYLLRVVPLSGIYNPIAISASIAGILVADVNSDVVPATSYIVLIPHNTDTFTTIDMSGSFSEYTSDGFYSGSYIKHMTSGVDPSYFYVSTDTLVYKITYDFKIIDSYGEIMADIAYAGMPTGGGPYKLTQCSASVGGSLVVSTTYDIHRMTDVIRYLKMIQDDVKSKMWDLDSCKVSGDEYATDWVYNRCFNRLYDNIVRVHSAIIGIPTPEFSLPVDEIVLGGFRPNQYTDLPYTKDDIYVGINEIHAEASMNRAFRMLYGCMVHILNILNQSNYTIDDSIISLSNFRLDSFIGSSTLTPCGGDWSQEVVTDTDTGDQTVYLDKYRETTGLTFKWDDSFEGDRSNPNFKRSFKYRYNPYVAMADKRDGVYTDDNTYYDNGSRNGGSWGVRVSYNVINLNQDIDIYWGHRIYIGTLNRGEAPTITNIKSSSNVKWTSVRADGSFDIEFNVNIGDDSSYYIALPVKDVLNHEFRCISVEGDGSTPTPLDNMLYTFNDATVFTNFEEEYTAPSGSGYVDYVVYKFNKYNGSYLTDTIKYRLLMGSAIRII